MDKTSGHSQSNGDLSHSPAFGAQAGHTAFGYVGVGPAPEHPAIAKANALRRLDLP
jgi:hypothetical protein